MIHGFPKPQQAMEVKSCVYCKHAEVNVVLIEVMNWRRFAAECAECGARGPRAEHPRDAIQAWNARAEPEHDSDA